MGQGGGASVFMTWIAGDGDEFSGLVVTVSRHRIAVPTPFTPSPSQAASGSTCNTLLTRGPRCRVCGGGGSLG